MFGPLKRLFSRPVSPPPVVAASPAPVAPPIPAPAPTPSASAGDSIQVPWQDIVPRLPASITPLILSSVNGTFALPAQTALAQLPTGAVRVSFAQLRGGLPPGTFAENPSLDSTLIELPLPPILAAMNPALLARRPGQKQIAVSDEITGIFGAKGNPAVAFTPPPSPPAPSPPPKPIATPLVIPAPIPMPLTPKVATAPLQKENVLTVPLSALCESWSAEVRQEVTASRWNEAVVSLPMERLDASMKAGRVAFTWGEVIGWLDVPPPDVPSRQGTTMLEIPLKVIAPLFMSRRKVPIAQKKTVIGENIPDLFAGVSKAAPPIGAAAEPLRNEWSPQEITKKINALPGVAASLIAMSDGLLVSGGVPSPLKSEMMAAFLPQLFGRMSHFTGEIQLGPLAAITLWAGQTQCAIFKTGALYLAVLAQPGHPLPEAALQRMASEMAQRNP